MAELSELLPELRAWNDGTGIQPLDWVYCIARSDEAVAYTALFWPKFVEIDGYILRGGFNLDNLRSWEAQQHVGRQQIELAINLLDVGFLFYNSKEPGTAMLEARTIWMLDRVPGRGVAWRHSRHDLRQGRADQTATAGRLTRGSSLKGATLSTVM